jgi:hypothetical protein
MKALGTILPTRKILKAGDRAADQQAMRDKQAGVAHFGFEPSMVYDELRWSLPERRYATVRNGIARIFETREDGDYVVERIKL